jgi:hypothetical protein
MWTVGCRWRRWRSGILAMSDRSPRPVCYSAALQLLIARLPHDSIIATRSNLANVAAWLKPAIRQAGKPAPHQIPTAVLESLSGRQNGGAANDGAEIWRGSRADRELARYQVACFPP